MRVPGVDQPPQDRLLADDVGVVGGVGGDRHRRGDRVQVGGTADALELAAPLELVGDGHHVGRLAATVEVDDRVVDRLVAGPVEVGAPDHLGHVGDGVLGDHHRAQHRLLGRHVLGRGPVAGRTLAQGSRRRTRSGSRVLPGDRQGGAAGCDGCGAWDDRGTSPTVGPTADSAVRPAGGGPVGCESAWESPGAARRNLCSPGGAWEVRHPQPLGTTAEIGWTTPDDLCTVWGQPVEPGFDSAARTALTCDNGRPPVWSQKILTGVRSPDGHPAVVGWLCRQRPDRLAVEGSSTPLSTGVHGLVPCWPSTTTGPYRD